MKAFLLAAGLGTRLRPITLKTPKCLVPINDKPLLQWWIELFAAHGINEVMINTHYLRDQVKSFIDDNNSRNSNVILYEAWENELSGSAGTVRDNKNFVSGEKNFLIAYADNLTDANLTDFKNFHDDVCVKNNGILSMALFHTNLPSQCGIATLDDDMRIVKFIEKPAEPESNLANAGIYIATQKIFDVLSEKCPLDFGRDILPELTGKMYGWINKNYLLDIGTPENYERAQTEWRNKKS